MAYFANGTEGMILDAQCCECKIPNDDCTILLIQVLYNYEQIRNDLARKIMGILVDDDGICQMKTIIDELVDGQE